MNAWKQKNSVPLDWLQDSSGFHTIFFEFKVPKVPGEAEHLSLSGSSSSSSAAVCVAVAAPVNEWLLTGWGWLCLNRVDVSYLGSANTSTPWRWSVRHSDHVSPLGELPAAVACFYRLCDPQSVTHACTEETLTAQKLIDWWGSSVECVVGEGGDILSLHEHFYC